MTLPVVQETAPDIVGPVKRMCREHVLSGPPIVGEPFGVVAFGHVDGSTFLYAVTLMDESERDAVVALLASIPGMRRVFPLVIVDQGDGPTRRE